LARADSATTRGPYVGDDDAVFHLGDARRDHVTRSTSRQGVLHLIRCRLQGKNSLVIGEEVFDCAQLKRSASA
jgi:calcineurin-like phosphoesterase family protein